MLERRTQESLLDKKNKKIKKCYGSVVSIEKSGALTSVIALRIDLWNPDIFSPKIHNLTTLTYGWNIYEKYLCQLKFHYLFSLFCWNYQTSFQITLTDIILKKIKLYKMCFYIIKHHGKILRLWITSLKCEIYKSKHHSFLEISPLNLKLHYAC